MAPYGSSARKAPPDPSLDPSLGVAPGLGRRLVKLGGLPQDARPVPYGQSDDRRAQDDQAREGLQRANTMSQLRGWAPSQIDEMAAAPPMSKLTLAAAVVMSGERSVAM